MKFEKLLPILLFFCLLFFIFFGVRIPYINLIQSMMIELLWFMFLSSLMWQVPNTKKVILPFAVLNIIFYLFINFSVALAYSFLLLWFLPPLSFSQIKKIANSVFDLLEFLFEHAFWQTVSILLLIGIFWFYRNSFGSYFEGDEWIFFRYYNSLLNSKIWFLEGFLESFRTVGVLNPHITPIADMFYVIEFKLFGLYFIDYIIISIFLHVCICFVLAQLLFELTRSKCVTFIGTIFFAFSAIPSEAVIWILAALYTELAVFFGLLSLLFMLRALNQKGFHKNALLSYLFLLFALWSKETAIVFFIVFTYLLLRKRKSVNIKHIWYLIGVLLIFGVTEVIGRRQQLFTQPSTSINLPWTYRIVMFFEAAQFPLLFFRSWSFFLKMLAQSIFPARVIKEFSIALTDAQFPFFNQEKEIGGTTYVNFIQSPMPELISYVLGTIVFFGTFLSKKLRSSSSYLTGVGFWFLGIIPILGVLVGFPWLVYSPYISSRHFYHLYPGLALAVAVVIANVFWRIQAKKGKKFAQVILMLLVTFYVGTQYFIQSQDTAERQKASDFQARKSIVDTLTSDINPVQKKLIIYTTSNRNYYGFGLLMLPFPTAFSHMLPIIFSNQFNPHGLAYPNDFFNQEYLKNTTAGLATQGYFEKDGYGMGYFLEKPKLIKALEKNNLNVDTVYAYRFNGDDNSFTNFSTELRDEIQKRLDSRMIFRTWITQSFSDDAFTIQVDPSWSLQKKDTTYTIFDQKKQPIMDIFVYSNMKPADFTQFVKEQTVDDKVISTQLGTDTLLSDLGLPRLMYFPNWNKNVFFVATGKGTTYYRISIHQVDEAKLLLRTLEFDD